MPSPSKILLVGATGYVGGTILDHILKSQERSIEKLTLDLLVRGPEAAEKLQATYGDRVNPILWEGLADTTFISDVAANYDIILNTGFGFEPDGAEAFIQGLTRRITSVTPTPWLLHLSGCSNLADRPLTQTAHPTREWDDANSCAVYEFLKAEDVHDPYPQRTAEIRVLSAAEKTGVQAISVNTPCIFGTGSGIFRRQGFIIPAFMRFVIQHGYGFKLNETANFDWVHVDDLADIFVLLLRTILQREDHGIGFLPSGKTGIMSSSVGHTLQIDMMRLCLDAAFDAGVLPRDDTPKEKEIRQVSLQEIADEIMDGLVSMAERSWAGHKKMKGTVARQLLGWDPKRLEESWKQDFIDVLNNLRSGKTGGILEYFSK
ncbi:hypothetical protein BKA56DRAFT_605884 [Ilyonectria sp. MPI-CAGE-AT-0026]|nr:hypothetical protein BKA56DRAFT_605884 [Ilyonectria sp. MPI-CAGE-AT-0026]